MKVGTIVRCMPSTDHLVEVLHKLGDALGMSIGHVLIVTKVVETIDDGGVVFLYNVSNGEEVSILTGSFYDVFKIILEE